MKLSDHFNLSEFACPDGCGKEAGAVDALRALCEAVLEPLRADLGVPLTIHSGFRCGDYNRRCGGAKASQHLLGVAADVKCDKPTDEVHAAAKRIQARRGRGGVGKYARFTHVDNRKGRSSWEG